MAAARYMVPSLRVADGWHRLLLTLLSLQKSFIPSGFILYHYNGSMYSSAVFYNAGSTQQREHEQ